MCQIETTGFVIAETPFDAYPTGIFSQASSANDLIGYDRHHFGLASLIHRPSDRDMGWYYVELASRVPDLAPRLHKKIQACQSWIEECAGIDMYLPELIAENLNVTSYYPVWVKRWGEIASPLLWAHANYVILCSRRSILSKQPSAPEDDN
jgi:hypothetical protein